MAEYADFVESKLSGIVARFQEHYNFAATITDTTLLTNLGIRLSPGWNITRELETVLALVPRFSPTIEVDLETVISLSVSTDRVHTVDTVLNLTISTQGSYGVEIDLNLVSNFTLSIDRTVTLETELTLGSFFHGYHETAALYCNYAPFLTDGSPISETMPLITPQDTVTFECADPALSITLSNPDLGDRQDTTLTRVYRTGLTGELQVYHDPNWPRFDKLTLEFSGLSQDKSDEFQQFLYLTIGKEITYTDHYGREWEGIILTPDAEFFQVGKEPCQYGTSVQFEGNLV